MNRPWLALLFGRWLIVLAFALGLGACGGRSDEDVLTPGLADARLDVARDAPRDAFDGAARDALPETAVEAEGADSATADAAIDVGSPTDARPDVLDAVADRPIDSPADARPPLDASADAADASSRVLLSIVLSPINPTINIGTKLPFGVTGFYSDKSTGDLTLSATFTSSVPSVATVAGNVVTAIQLGNTTITASVNGLSASTTVTVTRPAMTALTVTPVLATTGVGASVDFTAVGIFSDGSTQDVTASANWTSSNPTVASVMAGRAVGVSPGTTTLTATVGPLTASATLNVLQATLTSIAITPTSPTVPAGLSTPFQATGTYSDGSVADVTNTASWTSSDPTALTIAPSGLGTAIAPGTSIVTATVGAISGSTTVTVTNAQLQSITIAPAMSTLAVGSRETLVATGHYSDTTTADVSSIATWLSGQPSIAFVSNVPGSLGEVSGFGAGSTTITATVGGIVGSATVTVTAAKLTRIDIVPATATLPVSTTLAMKAQATFSDGSLVDITASALWSSKDLKIAAIGMTGVSIGQVTGIGAGTTQIFAEFQGMTGTATVTVTTAALVSIAVTPANSTITLGTRQSMIATGTYSDGSTVDITTTAVWTTGNAGVATVSNASGAHGQLTATGNGMTTVTASIGAVSGSTGVNVTAPIPSQLVIAPVDPTNHVGETRQFTATLIFSNGTQQNVTGRATWSVSGMNPVIASVTATGLVTARAVGTITISASFQGLTGSTTLTIVDAVPISIGITPIAPTLRKGARQAFTATAIFSDNTTRNVTAMATWTSSDPTVVAITTAGPMRGQATAAGPGTATIQATWNGLTGSTTVTVTDAVLTSIAITPANTTIGVGASLQFTATGTFSDGSQGDVTNTTTWQTSDRSIADVSTAAGSRGLAKGLGAGSVTITAAQGQVVGATSLFVK